jgi:hypothetical protein
VGWVGAGFVGAIVGLIGVKLRKAWLGHISPKAMFLGTISNLLIT